MSPLAAFSVFTWLGIVVICCPINSCVAACMCVMYHVWHITSGYLDLFFFLPKSWTEILSSICSPQGPVRTSFWDEHFTSHHLVILAVKCSTLTLFCSVNPQADHLHGIQLLRWEKVWWRQTFPNNEQKTDSAQCSNINFRKGIWGWLESWVPWKFWNGFIAVG